MLTYTSLKNRFIYAALSLLVSASALSAAPLRNSKPQGLALAQAVEPKRPLILVPGLLGSRLCRQDYEDSSKTNVVWGTLGALSAFSSLRLPQATETDDIRPCGLVREIVYLGVFTQEVYAPVLSHLHRLGYREGANLFIFDYDWRRSVFDNANELAAFVRKVVPDESQRVDVLAHSMGGLIARIYAVHSEGSFRISRLFSAGTPFFGSAQIYETLQKGWGVLHHVMGGLTEFRRTMLSFPSAFELMPRYEECCTNNAKANRFRLNGLEAWRALAWDGVDPATMPLPEKTSARAKQLREVISTALSPGIEDVLLVGVDQRTTHSVVFEKQNGSVAVSVHRTWAGDGTVIRESAVIQRAAVHLTSFADHEHILHDSQIQEFLSIALPGRVEEAMQTVRIKPRDSIVTRNRKITELVGIAIVPAQPIYHAEEKSVVHVHVRLGTKHPLSQGKIRLVLRRPDGSRDRVNLKPDPSASDPHNPFEQSFRGEFVTGSKEGSGVFEATVNTSGTSPRIVERSVGIVPR